MEIASLQHRAVASLVDGAALLTPTLAAGGGGAALYMWYRRRRSGSEDGDAPDAVLDRVPEAFRRFGESRLWQFALEAGLLPIEIRLRNWQSPGMRVLGLRRADSRTGGPVTVRSPLIHKAVVQASRELNRLQRRGFDERFRERYTLMKADLDEARRLHASDRDAQERAMREVVKRYGVTPLPACGRALVGIVPLYLPALWSKRNQTLPDRSQASSWSGIEVCGLPSGGGRLGARVGPAFGPAGASAQDPNRMVDRRRGRHEVNHEDGRQHDGH